MTPGRYIVEATDEGGSFDYDRMDNRDAAIALAKELVSSGLKPIVVDSREMMVVFDGTKL